MKKLFVGLCLICISVSNYAHADEQSLERARQIVEQATATANMFKDDPNMSYLHANLTKALGVLIIPEYGRVALIVGGAGGNGVLLKRQANNEWSNPAFYTMGSGSIGLQAGGGVSELILMVMTQRGIDSLLSSSFKLGMDASVAAGPLGVGAKAQTADILAFARSKGMFAGVSAAGSVIKVRDKYNLAYYGKAASPDDIINLANVANPHADALRTAVASMAQVGEKN